MSAKSGWHVYKGTTIMQHDNISNKLRILFNDTKPSQILEIGTSSGGLTLLIRDILDELDLINSSIRSYDIIEMSRYFLDEAIKNGAKIELLIKNIFKEKYDDVIESEKDDVVDYIQQKGRTIIMCDGGCKMWEFNIFAKYLKPNDIIMAHDYSPDMGYFEEFIKGKIWDWCEVKDADIQESINKYELEPFMRDDFREVVWVCMIKK